MRRQGCVGVGMPMCGFLIGGSSTCLFTAALMRIYQKMGTLCLPVTHTHTHTHTHTCTHTLTRSPEGHLVLHKLALVGWGLSGCKLVRRCISLKVWTRLTLPTVDPSIMLPVFCSPPPASPPLFCLFAAFSCFLLFPNNSPPPRLPLSFIKSVSFSSPLHLCLPPPPAPLAHSPTPRSVLRRWLEWKVLCSITQCSCCGVSLLIHSEGCLIHPESATVVLPLPFVWMLYFSFTYRRGEWACLLGWCAGTWESAFI